jgi:transposase InsO family protein
MLLILHFGAKSLNTPRIVAPGVGQLQFRTGLGRRLEAELIHELRSWLHTYNWHRPHASLNQLPHQPLWPRSE